ncbi:phosphatase PAP2 family protein [Streptomyces sp. SDT5-1]|uniref:phosphatase PAP2 family protein n=1 Tax=Streptomyces sp. SDT5-1 TaxID=3406418 RepID=UPI003FD51503
MHPARLDSPPRRPRPALALCTALAVPSVLLLVLVAVRWSPLMGLDRDIARSLHGRAVADPGITRVNRVLTDWVWDPWTMRLLCAVVVLALVWRLRDWLLAGWVAGTCLVGTLLQQGLKAAVDRPRPVWRDPVDSAHYAAFPSGHAMTAAVVCGLVLWLLRRYGAGRALWRTALALAVVSVLGVGLTRLWLGVHWPTDVLGGWLLGALTVTPAVAAYDRWVAPNARA